jgi:hypothetical protein
VILIDESGSLAPVDVEYEKLAAQVLAFGMISNDSEAAVVGFGSSNGSGQSPVDVVCPLTGVEPSKQAFFVDCIGRLHRRAPGEGADADHVAALAQALSILGQPGGEDRTKVVFLLTDSVLSVGNSPRYGGDPEARNANAQLLLNDKIAEARGAGVQIWPVGFGSVDGAALDAFAAGGAQQDCGNDLPAYRPRARIATSSEVAVRASLDALAGATCAGVTGFDTAELSGGSQVELHVDIPEISTDGVLAVIKGDARVRVRYLDPTGREVTGTGTFEHDGSIFTASTPLGSVESLRIQNPRPGRWTIRLSAAPDVPTQVVGATLPWQGVLQAVLLLDPAAPRAGEEAVVRVRLQTRDGVIEDPRSLLGVTAGALMSVALAGGRTTTELIELADDGRHGDIRGGDGEYTGSVEIPEGAEGVLTFVGTVDGPGVVSARTPYNTVVSPRLIGAATSITIDRGVVHPGGEIHGTVAVDNADGQPRRLRLALSDLSRGTRAGISGPSVVDIPRAGRVEQDFAIAFGDDTEEGAAQGTISLVDAADDGRVYAQEFFSVDVASPDPWWAGFWWLWLLAAVTATVGAAVVARLRHTSAAARSVDGVTVHLGRAGLRLAHLTAPDGVRGRFIFTIHDPQGFAPRLEMADGYGESTRAYIVTRVRGGMVQVRTPEGALYVLSPRNPVAVEHGLTLTLGSSSDEVISEAYSTRFDQEP